MSKKVKVHGVRCRQCLRKIDATNKAVRSSRSEVLECGACREEYKFRNKMEKVGCIACGHVHQEVNISDDRLTELLSDCVICGYNHFTGDYNVACDFEDVVARDRDILDVLFDGIELVPGDLVVLSDGGVEGIVSSVDGEMADIEVLGVCGAEIISVPVAALEVARA